MKTERDTFRLLMISHVAPPARDAARFPTRNDRSERDLGKARALAARLPRPDRAWCGPTVPDRTTAQALELEAMDEGALREPDFGDWSGQDLAAIAAASPDLFQAWLTDSTASPPNGEAAAAVIDRVGGWLDRLASAGDSGIAVASPLVVRAAVAHVLGAPAITWFRVEIGYLTRTVLTRNGPLWRVAQMNVPLAHERSLTQS